MTRIDWMYQLGWTEDHLDELRNIGYSYLRQGKYEIALPFFEALVALVPESLYDIQTLGALFVQIDQPQKAIQVLNKALMFNADHGPTLLNLMKAYFMAKERDQGLRLAEVLKNDKNSLISGTAEAFILSYSKGS
jgi:tetratricopeptide (TPR) repeat protein